MESMTKDEHQQRAPKVSRAKWSCKEVTQLRSTATTQSPQPAPLGLAACARSCYLLLSCLYLSMPVE